ncbi:MAG: hypothetical protein LBT10_01845 [Methanobrevibacter sp.]|jgi:hypothetical protein|nr:hypothetical protein [Methanobrevibacter sp.]
MKIIKHKNGDVLLDDDVYRLIDGRCSVTKNGHDYYTVTRYNKTLARLILGLEKGDKRIAEHKDGNSLNNQRSNLRITTHSQNCRNTKRKGYSYCKQRKKFRVNIQINNKRIYIGQYSSEVEAKEAYKDATLKYFGDFSYYRRKNT